MTLAYATGASRGSIYIHPTLDLAVPGVGQGFGGLAALNDDLVRGPLGGPVGGFLRAGRGRGETDPQAKQVLLLLDFLARHEPGGTGAREKTGAPQRRDPWRWR